MSFEIVEHRVSGEPTLTQVTAWAGRTFCFDRVIPNIVGQVDLQDTHVVWLDNSQDPWFRAALLAHAEPFANFTLIQDCSDQFNINPYMRSPDDERVAAHMRLAEKIYETYQACFLQLMPSSQMVWVVEDDVEIPRNAFARMRRHLLDCPELGTVAGRMLDRRSHEMGREETVVTEYEISMILGRNDSAVVKANNMHAVGRSPSVPKWGTQIVGSTHMGCWLSRSELIRSPGIAPSCDGVIACDNCWGWRIWKERRMRVAVDWSIHCRHHYLDAQGRQRVAE
jgi:hypothetical protein